MTMDMHRLKTWVRERVTQCRVAGDAARARHQDSLAGSYFYSAKVGESILQEIAQIEEEKPMDPVLDVLFTESAKGLGFARSIGLLAELFPEFDIDIKMTTEAQGVSNVDQDQAVVELPNK